MADAKGFTLIELLVTLAIVALLSTITIPLAQVTVQRQKEQQLRQALHEIRSALDQYQRASAEGRVSTPPDSSGYPPSLAALAEGVKDRRSAGSRKLYFLRAIPRDPFCSDPALSNEQCWAPRAYQSDPDNPKPGVDVYDVHSRSEQVGLNGIPYRRW